MTDFPPLCSNDKFCEKVQSCKIIVPVSYLCTTEEVTQSDPVSNPQQFSYYMYNRLILKWG